MRPCMRTHAFTHARTFCRAHPRRVHLARAATPDRAAEFCAAAYAWGDSSDNTCPKNAVRIGSKEACHRAADVMGMDWAGSNNLTDRPRGCFWNEEGGRHVFFNAHPVGSGHARRLPLCLVGTAPLALPATCPPPLAPSLQAHIHDMACARAGGACHCARCRNRTTRVCRGNAGSFETRAQFARSHHCRNVGIDRVLPADLFTSFFGAEQINSTWCRLTPLSLTTTSTHSLPGLNSQMSGRFRRGHEGNKGGATRHGSKRQRGDAGASITTPRSPRSTL